MSLGAIAVLAAAARLLPLVDWDEAAKLLGGVGLAALLLPLPYAAMLLIDAVAWRYLLPEAAVPGLWTRLRVRSVAEAVSMVLPIGGVGGDAAASSMLHRPGGPSPMAVTASLIARRVVLGQAHGLVVLLGALALGFLGPDHLALFAWPIAGIGAGVTAGCAVAILWLRRGAGLGPLRPLLRRAPRCLPRRMRARGRTMARLSEIALAPALATSLRAPQRSTALYVVLFFLEAIETWLILRVLGAGPGLLDVLAFEAPLSLLRSVVPFLPAGLGVQDVGYVGALVAWNVPAAAAVAVALVVLKRGKEAAFALLGGLLWSLSWLRPGAQHQGCLQAC